MNITTERRLQVRRIMSNPLSQIQEFCTKNNVQKEITQKFLNPEMPKYGVFELERVLAIISPDGEDFVSSFDANFTQEEIEEAKILVKRFTKNSEVVEFAQEVSSR